MVQWLNRVVILLPRNATAQHLANPASLAVSGGTVIAGALFTPTAGRFLVTHFIGAVTATGVSGGGGSSAPSGWTAPTNASSVNNIGNYVWTKTAAGGDTLTMYHNGSDYAVLVEIFEYPAGTTFVKAANLSTGLFNAATPLTATIVPHTLLMTSQGWADGNPTATATAVILYSGTPTPVSLAFYQLNKNVTDGVGYVSAYADNTAATSWSPVVNIEQYDGSATKETVTYALNVPVPSTGPTTFAGVDQVNIEPGSTVTLTAVDTAGSSAITSSSWAWISGGSAPTLSGTNPVTFVAPATLAGVTMTFRRTVSDGTLTGTDDVAITILPASVRVVNASGVVTPAIMKIIT